MTEKYTPKVMVKMSLNVNITRSKLSQKTSEFLIASW